MTRLPWLRGWPAASIIAFAAAGLVAVATFHVPQVANELPGQQEVAEDDAGGGGPDEAEGPRARRLLVLGLDGPLDARPRPRSDVLLVLQFDPESDRVIALWVPRDTRVEIPGRLSPEKLGHAYVYGGAELARRTVEGLLGVTVDGTAVVDPHGFRTLVDAIGSVEVPDPDNPGATLVLDGDAAWRFVRVRERGDVERIEERQQLFVDAVLEQHGRTTTALRLLGGLSDLGNGVSLRLDGPTVSVLLSAALGVARVEVVLTTAAGHYALHHEDGHPVSYWIVDPEEVRVEAARLFGSEGSAAPGGDGDPL